VFHPGKDTLATVIKVNSDPVILRFILRHILYYLPAVGRHLFLADARKIVPTVKAADLRFGKGMGGIRPQVADVQARTLRLGEAKISAEGIIFNITPSPGASVCLKNAADDVRALAAYRGLGLRFDAAALAKDLG
jgi:malate dehydrogenase (quinone)